MRETGAGKKALCILQVSLLNQDEFILCRPSYQFTQHNSFFKDTSSWPNLARNMAEKTLKSAALTYPNDKADPDYNQTAHDIVNELKYTWFR